MKKTRITKLAPSLEIRFFARKACYRVGTTAAKACCGCGRRATADDGQWAIFSGNGTELPDSGVKKMLRVYKTATSAGRIQLKKL